ncbi:MAG: MYXO-CTERM sorting domain-containing protein [Myxococcales bacterium]|nr:MYXO-CTERM sorting domain-containing protein [Myxococcales bacterium]
MTHPSGFSCFARLSLCLSLPALAVGLALLPAEAEASRVVYINTEPVTVVTGSNDPAMNAINVNGYTETDFDGWAGATPEQVQEMFHLLRDVSVEFDIVFTLERPASGEYDMIVYGSADDHAASFGGTCSVQRGLSDCADGGGVSIGFMYWGCLGAADQFDPARVAFHTLGSLGYGWGLENISGVGQIMASWSATALKWGDACANLSGNAGCTHDGCAGGQQNSTADLLASVGARVDDGPPVLTVVSPQPGDDVTAPFDVVVEIDDAFGGLVGSLELVELGVDPIVDDSWPYGWAGLNVGAGPLTLRVSATDADGNVVSTDVPVCVGGGCPDTGTTTGDTTGDTGDTTDGTTTDGGDEVFGDDLGAGDDEGGCSCASEPGSGGAAGTLGLLGLLGLGLGLGLRRRRR